MRKLPDNYKRCDATKCDIKNRCARYTSTPGLLSIVDFSLSVKPGATCNMFEENAE